MIGGIPSKLVRTRAQAADVPLDEALAGDAVDEDEEEGDEDAVDFESDPVEDDDDDDSDPFAGDVTGVLLDEEPRLSFR
ncbi:cobalamin biosynthesis protein CobT [Streptomyces fulvorobeus]|nr:cobalamin biosynthesis protein CobT [Streptomyces fulvorobeus]